jgi:hypothetical protein
MACGGGAAPPTGLPAATCHCERRRRPAAAPRAGLRVGRRSVSCEPDADGCPPPPPPQSTRARLDLCIASRSRPQPPRCAQPRRAPAPPVTPLAHCGCDPRPDQTDSRVPHCFNFIRSSHRRPIPPQTASRTDLQGAGDQVLSDSLGLSVTARKARTGQTVGTRGPRRRRHSRGRAPGGLAAPGCASDGSRRLRNGCARMGSAPRPPSATESRFRRPAHLTRRRPI